MEYERPAGAGNTHGCPRGELGGFLGRDAVGRDVLWRDALWRDAFGQRFGGPAQLRVVGATSRGGLDEAVTSSVERTPGGRARVTTEP